MGRDFDDDFWKDFDDIDDWNMGHWASSILTIIFWVAVGYLIYYFCCRKKKNQGAVFTSEELIFFFY